MGRFCAASQNASAPPQYGTLHPQHSRSRFLMSSRHRGRTKAWGCGPRRGSCHARNPRSPRLRARPPRATPGCGPRAEAGPRAAPRLPLVLTSWPRPPRSTPGAPARRAGEAPRRPAGRRSRRRRVPRGAAAAPRPWG